MPQSETQAVLVVTTLPIAMFTCVFWEADSQGRLGDFLCKQIFLVKEEDYRRICEPFVVADGIKQLHALHHTVLQHTQMENQDTISIIGTTMYTNSNCKTSITQTPCLFTTLHCISAMPLFNPLERFSMCPKVIRNCMVLLYCYIL